MDKGNHSRREFLRTGLATITVLSTSKSLAQSSLPEGFGKCYTCMNFEERGNMCPQKKFPSGLCGAYEPVDVNLYNNVFGPKVEGLVAKSA